MKVFLFDTDGVILTGEYKYFSEKYAKEHSVDPELIIPFFKNEFEDCLLGKLDVKDALKPYLKKWDWNGDADSFLKYWFSEQKKTNQEILEKIKELRHKGHNCYIVTDQEKYRAEYMKKNNELFNGASFDGYFFSCELGYVKSQQEFFTSVLKKVANPAPQDVYFWDDNHSNVDSAISVGINGYLYESFENLEDIVNQFLS